MNKDIQICPACGARLAENALQCDLCGFELSENRVIEDELVTQAPEPVIPVNKPVIQNRFCDQCGAENRPEARFCYLCGAPMPEVVSENGLFQTIPPTQPLRTAPIIISETSAITPKTRTLWVVGSALLVVVLFGVTMWSKANYDHPPLTRAVGTPATESPQAEAAPVPKTAPIPKEVQVKADELMAKMEKETNATKKQGLTEELAFLYQQNQREDLAGNVMIEAAKTINTADIWAKAGHLWYDWMDKQPDPQARIDAAGKAIDAYEKSLAVKDNPDVRTDLGAAYLTYAITEAPKKDKAINPMKAIENTNKVLDQNPSHVQANFNKGVMLMTIGRNDNAKTQFEKVKSLSKPGEPAYQRAEAALQQMNGGVP
ncbi:MAG: zinc ribbon domain-containing protein [Bacteroidetes Order II. Incertae sedis bacterium]|nr:zinc ribbon domain-containing protein [Bacteroidetes Order II. bacterium]